MHYFAKPIKRKKRKRINRNNHKLMRRLVRQYQKELDDEEYGYQLSCYDPDHKEGLQLFILKFISDYNKNYHVIDGLDKNVGNMGTPRCLGEIYLVCKSYYQHVTIQDVATTLVDLVKRGTIKAVYDYGTKFVHYAMGQIEDVKYMPTEFDGLSWKAFVRAFETKHK